MFKKREAKKGGAGLRKKRAVDEEGPADEAEDQTKLLADLREEQLERKRTGGIQTAKLLEASEAAMQAKQRKKEEAEQTSVADTGADLKSLMTNQFTEQVGLATQDDKAHEKRMEEFIQKELREKLGARPGEGADEDPTAGLTAAEAAAAIASERAAKDEEELYHMPDELNPRLAAPDGKEFDKREGFSGEAAPLFMNTGIAEVTLPVEFRMKNIQQTEKAQAGLAQPPDEDAAPKRAVRRTADGDVVFHRPSTARPGQNHGASRGAPPRVLSRNSRGDPGGRPRRERDPGDVPAGSFNSNFNQHRREWAEMMHKRRGDNEGDNGSGGGGGRRTLDPSGRSAASDDAVYERYKKRTRR